VKASTSPSSDQVRKFFARSDWLDYLVLRPLGHVSLHWETRWDSDADAYEAEPGTFAGDLNVVIGLIAAWPPPRHYHDHEDLLAGSVIRDLHWPIQKKGSRWIGADYASILEQGAFRDLDQRALISAASGRVQAAFRFGQFHFDEMEDGHQSILAELLTIITYHRLCAGTSLYRDE